MVSTGRVSSFPAAGSTRAGWPKNSGPSTVTTRRRGRRQDRVLIQRVHGDRHRHLRRRQLVAVDGDDGPGGGLGLTRDGGGKRLGEFVVVQHAAPGGPGVRGEGDRHCDFVVVRARRQGAALGVGHDAAHGRDGGPGRNGEGGEVEGVGEFAVAGAEVRGGFGGGGVGGLLGGGLGHGGAFLVGWRPAGAALVPAVWRGCPRRALPGPPGTLTCCQPTTRRQVRGNPALGVHCVTPSGTLILRLPAQRSSLVDSASNVMDALAPVMAVTVPRLPL